MLDDTDEQQLIQSLLSTPPAKRRRVADADAITEPGGQSTFDFWMNLLEEPSSSCSAMTSWIARDAELVAEQGNCSGPSTAGGPVVEISDEEPAGDAPSGDAGVAISSLRHEVTESAATLRREEAGVSWPSHGIRQFDQGGCTVDARAENAASSEAAAMNLDPYQGQSSLEYLMGLLDTQPAAVSALPPSSEVALKFTPVEIDVPSPAGVGQHSEGAVAGSWPPAGVTGSRGLQVQEDRDELLRLVNEATDPTVVLGAMQKLLEIDEQETVAEKAGGAVSAALAGRTARRGDAGIVWDLVRKPKEAGPDYVTVLHDKICGSVG